MNKQITVKYISNASATPREITETLSASLWEKGEQRRWYVRDSRGAQLCFDANTGERIKAHREISNSSWISQIKEQLEI